MLFPPLSFYAFLRIYNRPCYQIQRQACLRPSCLCAARPSLKILFQLLQPELSLLVSLYLSLNFLSLSVCPSALLCVCVSVSVCLSVCLCLSVSVSVCVSVCFTVCLCVCLCLSVCLCLFLSVCLSVCLSVSVSVSLCLCLSLSLTLSLSLSLFSCKCLSLVYTFLCLRIMLLLNQVQPIRTRELVCITLNFLC